MRKAYLVSGIVQGVGFRQFTRREGRRIGVAGWVRNLADGRVEALAEGTSDQLNQFEDALRRGPSNSSVTDVHATDTSDEVPPFITFNIR